MHTCILCKLYTQFFQDEINSLDENSDDVGNLLSFDDEVGAHLHWCYLFN